MNRNNLKNIFLAVLLIGTWGTEYSLAEDINRDRGGGANNPPRYEPRPSPGPGPRPSPRPEPRPNPGPRPEPRPSPRPNPRPEPRPPRPRPPYPQPEPRPPYPYPRPPRPSPVHYSIVIDVNRTLSNYERIDLDQYFNFYQFAGYEIDSVQVMAEVYHRSMSLSLISDRAIEATAAAYEGYSTVMLYPRNYLVIRSNTNQLEIMARGNGDIRINQVVIRVTR